MSEFYVKCAWNKCLVDSKHMIEAIIYHYMAQLLTKIWLKELNYFVVRPVQYVLSSLFFLLGWGMIQTTRNSRQDSASLK